MIFTVSRGSQGNRTLCVRRDVGIALTAQSIHKWAASRNLPFMSVAPANKEVPRSVSLHIISALGESGPWYVAYFITSLRAQVPSYPSAY